MKFLPFLLFLILFVSALAIPLQKRNYPGARIIGGQPAFEGQFPYAAAIHVTTPNGRYFCGGALISNQWILSAGQCVNGATLFNIELGSTHLESDDSNALNVQATQSIIHPDFDATQFLNDLGLIQLTQPVAYTNYIKPIDFFPVTELGENAPARALGWGSVSDSSGGPVNNLNWVQLVVISNEECAIFYGDQIKEGMVCVVGQDNEGTCIGDTGMPLIQAIANGHHIHVGIASFLSGNGCESTDPSGYTRTFPYRDWISNTTAI